MEPVSLEALDFIRRLEKEWLPAWVSQRRWFGGKSRTAERWSIVRHVGMGNARLYAVEVRYSDGGSEVYAVPLAVVDVVEVADPVARLQDGRVLVDAVMTEGFRAVLLEQLRAAGAQEGMMTQPGVFLAGALPASGEVPSRVLAAEQSNTSLIYGERVFAKLYRRLSPGVNPDAEITRYLSENTPFRSLPAYAGEVVWAGASLMLALELCANEGDAWAFALRMLPATLRDEAGMARWLDAAHLLGRRTGEMHRALAMPTGDAAFAPEPFTLADAAALEHRLASAEASVRAALNSQAASTPLTLPALPPVPVVGVKTRTHGDYHLGQVLVMEGDFLIIDFEGEPSRSLDERRAKQPPIRDVAGMLRSFHYAAHAARGEAPLAAVETWAARTQQAFLQGWRTAVVGTVIADEALLPYYLREKALYEVAYELNNRPAWLHIPLAALMAAA